MMLPSISSFSHNVFKRLPSQGVNKYNGHSQLVPYKFHIVLLQIIDKKQAKKMRDQTTHSMHSDLDQHNWQKKLKLEFNTTKC